MDKDVLLIARFAASLKQYAIFVRSCGLRMHPRKEADVNYKDDPRSRRSENAPKPPTRKPWYVDDFSSTAKASAGTLE